MSLKEGGSNMDYVALMGFTVILLTAITIVTKR